MVIGKCPNCAATIKDPAAGACAYCGNSLPPPDKKPRTPAEELSYEINGLSFCTVVLLVIAGVLWQIGWGRVALLIAGGWLIVLAGYSFYLYQRFGRR